jgi:hypothetical protein
MTDEIVAYMGWGISAQEQIDGLRREVRELRDENAKLRAASDTWQENDARLRELVRHLRECTRHNVCAACEYADDACDFDYDMRELGIGASADA